MNKCQTKWLWIRCVWSFLKMEFGSSWNEWNCAIILIVVKSTLWENAKGATENKPYYHLGTTNEEYISSE